MLMVRMLERKETERSDSDSTTPQPTDPYRIQTMSTPELQLPDVACKLKFVMGSY